MLRTAQDASSRTRSCERIRWSIRCAGMYPPGSATAVHPFAQLTPKNFVNNLPEPVALGYGLLEPDGTTNRSPAMLLANSCTPRFQRRAPGLGVATSSFLQLAADGPMGQYVSRRRSRFSRCHLALGGAVDADRLPGTPTSGARVARRQA
jgi:hypothetical protein